MRAGAKPSRATSDPQSLIRRHGLFVGIFLIVAAARFTILLASQTHVHSDEAIIGLMAKHILEGRFSPFYMYGQPYNAGAAWEAYLAAVAFKLFGVGVIPLKGCIVTLSLLCLFLFYRMGCALYDRRTAVLATFAFAFAPSLLKWNFQVRGYAWYFLSIPLLTILFASVESAPVPKRNTLFLFGLVSGMSIWCLELAAPIVAALWILLFLHRRISLGNAAVCSAGFALGYAPVIAWNLANHFDNWRYVVVGRPGGGLGALLQFSTYKDILLDEMPKFFGADTVLWYYPDKPTSGYVFYTIAVLAVLAAILPFARSPSKIVKAFRGDLADPGQQKDFYMLVLTAASLVPYLTVRPGVPSYFFGGCFFLSLLTGRLLDHCFSCSNAFPRVAGASVLGAILVTGAATTILVGKKNQIETLFWCNERKSYCMTQVPATDIEGVERDLFQHGVTSVWTTISFVYPLLFESGEKLAVSNSIFEDPYRVYPRQVSYREPKFGQDAACVIATDADLRPLLERRYAQATGVAPFVREYGKLTIIGAPSQSTGF
jgi:hypothetical protein